MRENYFDELLLERPPRRDKGKKRPKPLGVLSV
jgi:hypothetical protein